MEIYLHVPYCRQKCRYCDFASFPHAESTQRTYVDAVLTEAASQAAKIPHGAMETAYLGGFNCDFGTVEYGIAQLGDYIIEN